MFEWLQPPPRRATLLAAQPQSASKTNTFVILTSADLTSVLREISIRLPATAHSRPSFQFPLLSQTKDLLAPTDG